MSNLITKEIVLDSALGWQKLGVASRRSLLLDIFNESTDAVRIYMGADIEPTDVVSSIPMPAGTNHYVEGNTINEVYLKSTGDAAKLLTITYVEG